MRSIGFKTVAQLLSNRIIKYFINPLFRIRMGEDIFLNVGEIKNALEDLAYTKVNKHINKYRNHLLSIVLNQAADIEECIEVGLTNQEFIDLVIYLTSEIRYKNKVAEPPLPPPTSDGNLPGAKERYFGLLRHSQPRRSAPFQPVLAAATGPKIVLT